MGLAFRQHLSNRLLIVVLTISLAMGLGISLIRIALEMRSMQTELETRTQQLLATMLEPASQALYTLDSNTANEVLNGLFQNPDVRQASIEFPNGTELVFRHREAIPIHPQWLGRLFHNTPLEYRIKLGREAPQLEPDGTLVNVYEELGELSLVISPNRMLRAFLQHGIESMLTGLIQAFAFGLVLYHVFQSLITRPLARLLSDLEDVDPMRPARFQLTTPKGHEQDEIGRLAGKVNNLFHSIERHQNQRRVAEAHVERLSNYDMLTELPNRSLLARKIDEGILSPHRYQPHFAVICFALDDFKTVNLLHSYQVGDNLLLSLSERLQNAFPTIETFARVSGDVFALILPHASNHFEVAKFAQALLNAISQPFMLDGQEVTVTASAGIALYPDDDVTPDGLIKNAENVMRLAKNKGGNRYQFYIESIDNKIKASKRLERSLLAALENNQMQMVYQPLVDLSTGRCIGAEALLRWQHPELGLISPVEFVPMAEQNQSIIPIGEWVINEALETLRHWHALGADQLGISINVSMVQLYQPNLVDRLSKLIAHYQLPAHRVIVEMTETAVMTNVESAVQILKRMKAAGVELAIDDFGTGYSSLSYLKQMPLDKLKIDGSFINDLARNANNATIVETIIKLGHSLNLAVVAEGVETTDDVVHLRRLGCDIGQGFHFNRPLDREAFTAMICEQFSLNPAPGKPATEHV